TTRLDRLMIFRVRHESTSAAFNLVQSPTSRRRSRIPEKCAKSVVEKFRQTRWRYYVPGVFHSAVSAPLLQRGFPAIPEFVRGLVRRPRVRAVTRRSFQPGGRWSGSQKSRATATQCRRFRECLKPTELPAANGHRLQRSCRECRLFPNRALWTI